MFHRTKCETSASSDPKMTLEPNTCTCVINFPQILVGFALLQTLFFFELRATLRQGHWITLQWPLFTTSLKLPCIVVSPSPGGKTVAPFSLQLTLSKIFATFHFPIGHNVKFIIIFCK